ncbi:glyoxalase [Herbidospora galbida]|uniref:Glyoxalase n=1 Tax=Herbidospora galbida TaxID=2575442 RepID=A0A4U3M942_9ACTN|nr:VOC family protein [Herbidospora galbida]TKK84046.1 glyoxalase [Herbidospora galbida]
MNPTLNTIDIVVSDIAASAEFYALLGLDFKLDPHSPEHAGCDLPNGLHRTPFLPGWKAPVGGPRTLLCFQFDTPAEVDTAYAELTAAGHKGLAEPFDAFWGHRYATIADPDGNGVDLYATLPA